MNTDTYSKLSPLEFSTLAPLDEALSLKPPIWWDVSSKINFDMNFLFTK